MKKEKKEKKEKRKCGRPPLPIDWSHVDNLLMAGCHQNEVAAHFGIAVDTLRKRVKRELNIDYSEYIRQRKTKGNSLLRAHQFAKALGKTTRGDNTLLIWLGKQRLGQKENPDSEESFDGKLAQLLEKLMKENDE